MCSFYPGLSYVTNSALAVSWAERLGHEMHEVMVETNTFVLRLVCHDLRVQQLAVGDPVTRTLKQLDNEYVQARRYDGDLGQCS